MCYAVCVSWAIPGKFVDHALERSEASGTRYLNGTWISLLEVHASSYADADWAADL